MYCTLLEEKRRTLTKDFAPFRLTLELDAITNNFTASPSSLRRPEFPLAVWQLHCCIGSHYGAPSSINSQLDNRGPERLSLPHRRGGYTAEPTSASQTDSSFDMEICDKISENNQRMLVECIPEPKTLSFVKVGEQVRSFRSQIIHRNFVAYFHVKRRVRDGRKLVGNRLRVDPRS